MSGTRLRPGVDPNNLLVRRLRVVGLSEEKERSVAAELLGETGMDSVCWPDPGHLLEVAYDGAKRQLADVEATLARHGARLATDWRMRLKCSWYRFTEENVRANAQHVPHCCNKPPVA